MREGLVDGLRVDHPDGLADPAGYLERLRDGGVEHVWVEKILDPGERLRDWPVEGTVGYEFLNDVCALFVDPAGEAALTELWTELSGDARPFGDWAAEAKLEQARTTFAPDVDWLRRLWPGVEGLEEALAALPVYRTYIRGLPAPEDLHVLREAGLTEWLAQAPRAVPDALPAADAADHGQGRRGHGVLPLRAAARALCDVGGDPSRFSIDVRAVPRRQRRARGALPAAPALEHRRTTRSARATCARGSARSPGWRTSGPRAVRRWRALCEPLRAAGAPDAVEEYTIFQTLVGAWPIEPERLCAYMVKAMREAKRNTSWVEQDAGWEERVLGLLPRALRARAVPRRLRAVRRARSRRRASRSRCARRRSS